MTIYEEAVWMQAFDALDVARIEREKARICIRAANRYRRHGFDLAEARELRDAIFHQNRADLALLEALKHRANAKALRRVTNVVALAKTDPPPPPSDVQMVAGE